MTQFVFGVILGAILSFVLTRGWHQATVADHEEALRGRPRRHAGGFQWWGE